MRYVCNDDFGRGRIKPHLKTLFSSLRDSARSITCLRLNVPAVSFVRLAVRKLIAFNHVQRSSSDSAVEFLVFVRRRRGNAGRSDPDAIRFRRDRPVRRGTASGVRDVRLLDFSRAVRTSNRHETSRPFVKITVPSRRTAADPRVFVGGVLVTRRHRRQRTYHRFAPCTSRSASNVEFLMGIRNAARVNIDGPIERRRRSVKHR